jgi:hypothetical protein
VRDRLRSKEDWSPKVIEKDVGKIEDLIGPLKRKIIAGGRRGGMIRGIRKGEGNKGALRS